MTKLRIKGVNSGITFGGGNATEFISVWDTTLGDGSNVIVLPFIPEGTYNCTINWGDGSLSDSADSGKGFSQPSHTYETPGTYTITITGTVEGWSFGYDPNAGPFPPENPIPNSQEKLTSITNVGPLKLVDYGSYFVGCSNLTTIGGTFDLTGITNLGGMFANCTSLTSVNGIGSWNTSAVTDMDSMFNNATLFNGNISGWNVSSVTDMSSMFYDATAFNQNISGWNTAAVTDMGSMFAGASSFNQPLNSWNVSSVTNMSYMFANATAFNQDISGWDISNVADMGAFMLGKSTADYSYYDNLLNAWSALTLQNGVYWDMDTIEYTSAGATARQDIIDNYGWTINDGGEQIGPLTFDVFYGVPGTTLTQTQINNITGQSPTLTLTRYTAPGYIMSNTSISSNGTLTNIGGNQFRTNYDRVDLIDILVDGAYYVIGGSDNYSTGYATQSPYYDGSNGYYFLKWNATTGKFYSAGSLNQYNPVTGGNGIFNDYVPGDALYNEIDPLVDTITFQAGLPK